MTAVKLLVCVLSVVPAWSLLGVLQHINRHFIRAYDYRVLNTAITDTGAWAFIFLFITLACTPLQRLTGLRFPGELRRTFGLFAFFYSFLHFVVYMLIGQKLNWAYAWADALGQKSRIPGWLSLILLVPLVLTSTDGMIRRLGGKRWKNLHRLLYLSIAFAIAHVAWTEVDRQTNFQLTKRLAVMFAILMALRLVPRRKAPPKADASVSAR